MTLPNKPDYIMHYNAQEIDSVISKVMAETYFNYLGEKVFKYPKGSDSYSFLFPKASRGDWFNVKNSGHDGGPGDTGVDADDGDIFICLFDTISSPFVSVASNWLWMGKTLSGYNVYLNGYQIATTSANITDSDTVKSAFGKLEGRLLLHKQDVATENKVGHIKTGGEFSFDINGNVTVSDDVSLRGYPASETDFDNLSDRGVVTIEYLKSRLHLSITEYGIRRQIGSTDNVFERIKKEGFDVEYGGNYTTNVGVGSEVVTNDFDNLYPWKDMKLCNVDSGGEPIAYYGDPDFKLDGSNGPVMVEIPLFYQRYQYNPNNDGYEYWWISSDYIAGYYLNPRFAAKSRLYVGAYLAGRTEVKDSGAVDTYLISADAIPVSSKNYLWDDAGAWNDTMFWMSNKAYMTSKTGGTPVTTYSRDELRKFAKYVGEAFTIMDIHAWNILEYLFWIEFAKRNSQLVMKGYTANTNTGVIANGETDSVKCVSGSYQSNSDGLHPMKYRGIENLYGMMNQLIDGIIVVDNNPYINDIPSKYTSSSIDTNYTESSVVLPSSPGYINQISNDSLNHSLPVSATGNSTSDVGDYYENDNRTSEKNVLIGGKYNDGDKAGLSAFNTNVMITETEIPFVTRLIC